MPMAKVDFEKYIEVANDQANYALREFIAKINLLENENGCWSDLEMKDFKASIGIRLNKNRAPRDKEALSEHSKNVDFVKQVLMKNGDLALDVLDIIFARWLKSSNICENYIEISVDEILIDRALKKKKSSSGRRGGYTNRQRSVIEEILEALACLYIKVESMQITEMVNGKKVRKSWKGESRVMELKDSADSEYYDHFTFKIRPGKVLTKSIFVGRETALLNKTVLHYHPSNYKWEKRLSRYLSWLWRINLARTSRGLKVGNLLVSIGMKLNKGRLKRTKDRFEKALNRLEQDGVISSWHYEDFEINTDKYNWWSKWQERNVIIHPPEEVVMHYEKIKGKK